VKYSLNLVAVTLLSVRKFSATSLAYDRVTNSARAEHSKPWAKLLLTTHFYNKL